MHLELVAPGLLGARPLARMPALELLAARGRGERVDPEPLEHWLARAFGVDGPPLPAGALTLLGGARDPGDRLWLRADPVHLEVGLNGATLTPASALDVGAGESAQLVAALNAQFAGDAEWVAARPDCWCLGTARPMTVDVDVSAAASQRWDAALPATAASAEARALLTEVQMLLHRHPVNEARLQRGVPAINSVWLWGAGRVRPPIHAPWRAIAADDPVAIGLAQLAGIQHEALPQQPVRWMERLPADGRALCVLNAGASGDELDRAWFAPILAALRADRIGMVTLHVADAGRRWEATRGDLRRFWRRARALDETA